MGEEALTVSSVPEIREPSSGELLLIACELAKQVECMPQREDGTDAAVYESSGGTVARRIRAGVKFEASCIEASMESGSPPARFFWSVAVQANAARKTRYKIWIDTSREELKAMWQVREEARALRASLSHDQRKKKPWGLL